jgi:hypothetical protein
MLAHARRREIAMAFGKMVDLEFDDEDKLDAAQPMPMPEKPDYPYGTRICLCRPEMRKLQLDPGQCNIGAVIDLRCFGEVTSVSADRVEIQIQKMAVENEMDEEPAEPESGKVRKARKSLYSHHD